MLEKPAIGTVGFLLKIPGDLEPGGSGTLKDPHIIANWQYRFRIYDQESKRKFTDYKILHDDLQVKILGTVCFGERNGKRFIDYALKKDDSTADGIIGFILRSPTKVEEHRVLAWDYFFRIYDDADFTDYEIYHHDLKIEIIDDSASLYEDETGKTYIDYSSKVLGKE
jgi:hypothetical protein